jgi:hypothetical protein
MYTGAQRAVQNSPRELADVFITGSQIRRRRPRCLDIGR